MEHKEENPEAKLKTYISKIETRSAEFNNLLLRLAQQKPYIDLKRSSNDVLLELLKNTVIPDSCPKNKKGFNQLLKNIESSPSKNKNFQNAVELTILVSDIASTEADINRLERELLKLNKQSKQSKQTLDYGLFQKKESITRDILLNKEKIKRIQIQIEALIPTIDFSNVSLEIIHKAITPIWKSVMRLIPLNSNGTKTPDYLDSEYYYGHLQTNILAQPASKEEATVKPEIPKETANNPEITGESKSDNGFKQPSLFEAIEIRKKLKDKIEKRDEAKLEENYKKEVIRNTFIEMLKEEFSISDPSLQKALTEVMKDETDIVSRVINYVVEGFDLAQKQSIKEELFRLIAQDKEIQSFIEESYEKRFNQVFDNFQEMRTDQPKSIEEIDEEIKVIFEYSIEYAGIAKEWLENKRETIKEKFLNEFLSSKNQLKILKSLIPNRDIERDLDISENKNEIVTPQIVIENIQQIKKWNKLNGNKDFKELIGDEHRAEKITNTYLIYILSKFFEDLESLSTDYRNAYGSFDKARSEYEKLIKFGSDNELLVQYYIKILNSKDINSTLRRIYINSDDLRHGRFAVSEVFKELLGLPDIINKDRKVSKEDILEKIRKSYPNIDFDTSSHSVQELSQLQNIIENYRIFFLRYSEISVLLENLLNNISNEEIKNVFKTKLDKYNDLFSYKNFAKAFENFM